MQDLSKLIGDLHEHAKHAVEERARAEALFLNIGDGAIVTDDSGKISRINKTALRLLGLDEKDVLGKWFPKIIKATDENGKLIPPINRLITKAFLAGKTVSGKTFYKVSHRGLLPVHTTVSPIMLDNKPIGAIEVFRDISADYELGRMRDEFISIASHQLRTPATAVKNFIGLLRDGYAGKLTKEQESLIEMAYESNEQQLEIVNNLLYVARTDSEKVKLKFEKNDFVDLVRLAVAEQEGSIGSRHQHLRVDLPDEKIVINMDKQFIRMLVENLLTNASKYTPNKGKIALTVTSDTPTTVTVRVTDSGVGIAPEDMSKLFQKFSRIENELSTERGGSGIGLYLVKRIVDLHHGKVNIKSALGEGTTFTVVLPKEQPSG